MLNNKYVPTHKPWLSAMVSTSCALPQFLSAVVTQADMAMSRALAQMRGMTGCRTWRQSQAPAGRPGPVSERCRCDDADCHTACCTETARRRYAPPLLAGSPVYTSSLTHCKLHWNQLTGYSTPSEKQSIVISMPHVGPQ